MYHNDRFWPAITGPSGDQGSLISNEYINENTSEVYTFSASRDVTWSISGGEDKDFFTIDNSSGILSFIEQPDFEVPKDADLDNTYEVIVNATDLIGRDTQQTVNIGIVNVVEF